MDTARARLERFMEWTKLSNAEFARRLGCDPSYPAKLVKEVERRPGLDVALALEELSEKPRDEDGAVWAEGPIRAREWRDEHSGEAA